MGFNKYMFILNQFYAGYNSYCTFICSGNDPAAQTKLIASLIRNARRSAHVGYSVAAMIFVVPSHLFYPRCYKQNVNIVSVLQPQVHFAWSH
jgi:hypothetical protein